MIMKELQFPFDTDYILSKKKRIRRELLEKSKDCVEKRIAILGGSTTSNIKQIMELFLLNEGIKPVFYESEYNQWYEDAMFANQELLQFRPEIIYIHTTNRNVIHWPLISDSEEVVSGKVEQEYSRFHEVWKRLWDVYSCPIIQNNFELPYHRVMGNRESWDIHGKIHFINCLNEKFYKYAREHDNFYICDIMYLSSDYGLSKWSDPFYWHMYKYALSVPAIPYLSFNVANIIKSILGKNKKALVLDLDNTLWGGVVADDGVNGIQIGQETSEGQTFLEFQDYLHKQQDIGILLTVNSKNDHENAILGLGHPDGILKEKDFACIMANWEPKSDNLRKIALELKLLPESLVFVDDNPAERAIVSGYYPNVSVPEIGEPYNYIYVLDRSGFFEVTNLSQDDMKRNEMYRDNLLRTQMQSEFTNYDDYLRSLEMSAVIKSFDDIHYSRIAQLSNKSNQFNVTTKRYTQPEIEMIAQDDSYIKLYGRLKDKFGDNGLVSVVIGSIKEKTCHMDLWIMSCRVLKRDMEFAMLDKLVEHCIQKGIEEIRGYYYPTMKNAMVFDLYERFGFVKIAEDELKNTVWSYVIQDVYSKKNNFIEVKESDE